MANKMRSLKQRKAVVVSRGERRIRRRTWRKWRLMKAVHERVEAYGVTRLQTCSGSICAQIAIQLWREDSNGSALLRAWREWMRYTRNRSHWRKLQFVYTREISRHRMRVAFKAWATVRRMVRTVHRAPSGGADFHIRA